MRVFHIFLFLSATLVLPHPHAFGGTYDHPHGFGPALQWTSNFSFTNEVPAVGDFNGDGLDDVATFVRSATVGAPQGDVYVALNFRGERFAIPSKWNEAFGSDAEPVMTGDFNGDGRDDIIAFIPADGHVWVALSNGTAFVDSRRWRSARFWTAPEIPLVGDFNGDGRDDIAAFRRGAGGGVRVALSNGTSFNAPTIWHETFCRGEEIPRIGDVNGDGRADIVSFIRHTRPQPELGHVEVALSNGASGFAYGSLAFWHQRFATDANFEPLVADVNGDGSDDILAVHADGRVFAAVKTAVNSFASGTGAQTGDPLWQWHHGLRRNAIEAPLAGRFNRDTNSDLAVFMRGQRSGDERGAVFVSFAGGHAQPEPASRLADFGHGTMGPGASPPIVKPLLVLLSECASSPLSKSVDEYTRAVFGRVRDTDPESPNIAAWFKEMSNGAFTFRKVAVAKIGPYNCPLPDATSVRTQLEDAANVGGFNYRDFDTNGDGTVDNDELALLGIRSFYPGGGQAFPVFATVFPGTPRQVDVALRWCFAGDATGFHNMAHELAHGSLGMVDLYGSHCRGHGLTLASCTAGETSPTWLTHLDPWHKIRMGWVAPRIYDLRYFPAGEALQPPQLGGRPVILFDSLRGTNEFFVLEHRSGLIDDGTATWTAPGGPWRVAPHPAYPAAGYDIDVRDTRGNREGFLTWAVKTNAAHQVLDIPQRIGVGNNGVINSTAIGDDILWPGDPGTATAPQIHAGPDGVLQSVVAGDDAYMLDALCLPLSNPAEMLAREINTLHPEGRTPTTLSFYNSDDTGVWVHGDEVHEYAGGQWQFLEWGKNFLPWLDLVAAPAAARAGQPIVVTGSLGREARFRARLITPEGHELTPRTQIWSGTGASFTVPRSWRHRGGPSRFFLQETANPLRTSNSFTVTLADLREVYREETFTPAQRANPAISGDAADPDGDGLPNLGEFLFGTDPFTFNPNVPGWLRGDDGSLTLTFSARNDRGVVRMTLQTSTDLRTWTDGDSFTSEGDASTESFTHGYLRSAPAPPGGALYGRLAFTRL